MHNISAKHTEFINLVAKGTTFQEAYCITSNNKTITKATARVQGSILAKRYVIEIQETKKKDADLVSAASAKYDAQFALKSVVDQANADAKAFRILGDDDIVEDSIFVAGKVEIIKRTPTQGEIQKAYDLYCKRFGSNAPTKVASTNKDGEDVSPNITIQQLSISGVEIRENE